MTDPDNDVESTASPLAWVAGLLGIGILAVIGYLIFALLTAGTAS